MTREDYIGIQKKLGPPYPPCLECHQLRFDHCFVKGFDCKAFRIFAVGKTKHNWSAIGELKRKIKQRYPNIQLREEIAIAAVI